MTVTFPDPRYAVEHRPPGAKRWTTIVVCGSRSVATEAMFDLMRAATGDWAVREVTDPPRPTGRQARSSRERGAPR